MDTPNNNTPTVMPRQRNNREDELEVLEEAEDGEPKSPLQQDGGDMNTVATERPRWKEPFFVFGIVLLIMVNILWTAASVVVQHIYNRWDFQNYVLLTYICNAMFVILLPIDYVYQTYLRYNSQCMACLNRTRVALGLEGVKGETTIGTAASIEQRPQEIGYFTNPVNRKVMRAAFLISPIWFLAQCTYNWSLSHTTVTSNTILSTTSSVFTLGFSVLILKEGIGKWKILGVLLTVGGSVLVGVSDKDESDGGDTITGDFLALGSAVAYGLYTVLIRYSIPEDGSVRVSQLFGFIGLANLVLIFPVVLIFHFTGASVIDSMSGELFSWILLKGLIDNVLSDILWAWAITLTSPTISTVALSLTIPLAMLADLAFKQIYPSVLLVTGSIATIFGFVSTNVDPPDPSEYATMSTTDNASALSGRSSEDDDEHRHLLRSNDNRKVSF